MPPGFAYPEPEMAAWLRDRPPAARCLRSRQPLPVHGRPARRRRRASPGPRRTWPRVAARAAADAAGRLPRTPVDARRRVAARRASSATCSCRSRVLLAAAGSVLLIACVNVAIMALLRARRAPARAVDPPGRRRRPRHHRAPAADRSRRHRGARRGGRARCSRSVGISAARGLRAGRRPARSTASRSICRPRSSRSASSSSSRSWSARRRRSSR